MSAMKVQHFVLVFLWISGALSYKSIPLPDDYLDTNKVLSESMPVSEREEIVRNALQALKTYNKFIDPPPVINATMEKPTGNSDSEWSVVWYIASFSGLIAFFLVVSCSEWCCRRNGRANNTLPSTANATTLSATSSDTPPPSYDLFAPPSYDSLLYRRDEEKREYDIYVVPVHALAPIIEQSVVTEDSPPPYQITGDYHHHVQNTETTQTDDSSQTDHHHNHVIPIT